LQLVTHTKNSECFSIIYIIIFEVNIVAQNRNKHNNWLRFFAPAYSQLFLYFVRYQQTSILKTVSPNRARWDICLFNAQQWLQRLTFKGNCVEQL